MKFWDASAVVPLLLDEPASDGLRQLYRADPRCVVWWGTELECVSALSRREREGSIDLETVVFALETLDAIASAWTEILPAPVMRELARRLLRVHPLSAADAWQLAAALTAADRDPATMPMVCLDDKLSAAALREGLRVIGASSGSAPAG